MKSRCMVRVGAPPLPESPHRQAPLKHEDRNMKAGGSGLAVVAYSSLLELAFVALFGRISSCRASLAGPCDPADV